MQQRKKRRSGSDIEESINQAAVKLIKEVGFRNLTIRGIIKEAQIEPVVFYNRYDDILDFIDSFVKKYDYWFSKTTEKTKNEENLQTQYVNTLSNLLTSLDKNTIMKQLLRWELSETNEVTKRTAGLRQFHTQPLFKKYNQIFEKTPVDIEAVSSLIVGGIYYQVLHKNQGTFINIDMNTEEGQQRIKNAIAWLGELLFSEVSCPDNSISV